MGSDQADTGYFVTDSKNYLRKLESLKEGHESAWRELVSAHGPELNTYLRCNLPDESVIEKIMSDTFLQTMREICTVAPYSSMRVWLFRVAHERIASFWRKHAQTSDVFEVPALAIGNAEPMFGGAFRTLLVDERRVLVLHDLIGLEANEIADVMSRTEGNIRGVLKRGRSKLEQGMQIQKLVLA